MREIFAAFANAIMFDVLLTTCAELNGADYDYNVILDAGLQSSRRR